MHDFCFTIPYGFAVLAGGLLGYLRRGSTASLAGGAGVGGLLLLAGFVSLKAFEKRRNSYLALALETRTLRLPSSNFNCAFNCMLSNSSQKKRNG
ncbi:protein FATTY ACID EXPORT 5-like [Triticum urartu]|uniref:protein FATTY ACID EXPORT 5-like n=1 Tax=Triticum urartu TaxID=4572 RepID=UPI002043D7B7|nr:protein FATTY ACID EXPORT 5-like [Triticum urartu]